MRMLDLAIKDIRQVLREKQSLVFMLVMPIAFTFFFGFAFSGASDQAGSSDNRLVVGLVNQDPDEVLTSALVGMLESSETIRPELVGEAEIDSLDRRIVQGELTAGLIVPQGFSAAVLRGEDPQMEMIINEETDNGQTMRRALQTSITRVMGVAQSARSSLQAYEAAYGAFSAEQSRQEYLSGAVQQAALAWERSPLEIEVSSAVNKAETEDPLAVNPYNQFSPGMMVQFAFFGLLQASMVIVIERKNGVMSRLMTTPMRKTELIGGHLLGMFLIFFVQQLILVTFGQLVLKVDYFREPAATLLIMAALSLWVAATGLLISALVKNEEQVVLYSLLGMFIFSALGGAWFSLDMVGSTFAAIGHLMPSAWAIDGFQNIIVRRLGFESVLLPAGIVLAYAAAFFGIAVWRFRTE